MEKFTLEEFKPRKDYEKGVENITNPSLKERALRFFKTGESSAFKDKGLTKEDIISIDADLESKARRVAEGKEIGGKEQRYLDKLKNSDLIFDRMVSGGGKSIYPWHTDTIEGKINGQDVKVQNRYFLGTNELHTGGDGKTKEEESYEGSLNNKKLLKKDVKIIFDEYGQIAKNRIAAINKFLDEKGEIEELEKLFPENKEN